MSARKPAKKSAESSKPERESKPKSAPGRPFKSGQSGNPGGQPKWVRDLRPLLEKDAYAARRLLRSVIRDTKEDMKNRIRASEVVLKYAVPVPKAELDLTSGGKPLATVSTDVLVEFLQRRD